MSPKATPETPTTAVIAPPTAPSGPTPEQVKALLAAGLTPAQVATVLHPSAAPAMTAAPAAVATLPHPVKVTVTLSNGHETSYLLTPPVSGNEPAGKSPKVAWSASDKLGLGAHKLQLGVNVTLCSAKGKTDTPVTYTAAAAEFGVAITPERAARAVAK